MSLLCVFSWLMTLLIKVFGKVFMTSVLEGKELSHDFLYLIGRIVKTASDFPLLEVLDNFKIIFLSNEEERRQIWGSFRRKFYSLITCKSTFLEHFSNELNVKEFF